MSSPLVTSCLRSLLPECQVFEYAEDFESLWGDDVPAGNVVIVWDETPDDPRTYPINTQSVLSPLHWAVYATGSRVRPAPLVVTVLDLRAERHQSQVSLCRLVSAMEDDRVPWVRYLTPEDLVETDSRDEVKRILASPCPPGRPTDATAKLLQDFVRLELSDPADPDSRHSLSNLLGPLLLLGRPPRSPVGRGEAQGAGHLGDIHKLLEVCRAIPSDRARSVEAPTASTPIELPCGTRVFLLDDQWHQGWGEWVCAILGADYAPPESRSPTPAKISGESAFEVYATHSPNWLLDKLDGTEQRFSLRLHPEDNGGLELLLLDLRLFSERLQEEQALLERLRPICENFEKDNLAWRPITEEERTADVGTAAARSLLGRAIALTDPSLPIVLFSSTADRRLVESFDGYENIIGHFAKPRLPGLQTADLDKAARLFGESLHAASVLLRGRTAVTSSTRVAPAQPSPPGHETSVRYRHVAFYLDESVDMDSGALTVAGLLAFFPDSSAESSFDRELKEANIHWGPGGNPKYTRARNLAPGWCADILGLARERGIRLTAVALTVGREQMHEAVSGSRIHPPRVRQKLDRLHRTMIQTAVEIALFHVVRPEEMAAAWTAGVCADVRTLPAKLVPEDVQKVLRQQFGLYPGVLNPELRSIQLLEEILALLAEAPDGDRRSQLLRMLAAWWRDEFGKEDEATELVNSLAEFETDPPSGLERSRKHLRHILARSTSFGLIGTDAILPLVEEAVGHYEGAKRLRELSITEARGCHLPEGRKSALRPENRSLHFLADWVAGAIRASRGDDQALPGWLKSLLDQGGCNERFDTDLQLRLLHARRAMRGDVVRALRGLIEVGPPKANASRLRRMCSAAVAEAVGASPGAIFIDACRLAGIPASRMQIPQSDRKTEVERGPEALSGGARDAPVPVSSSRADSHTTSDDEGLIEAIRNAIWASGNAAVGSQVQLVRATRVDDVVMVAVRGKPARLIGPNGDVVKAVAAKMDGVSRIYVLPWSESALDFVNIVLRKWGPSSEEHPDCIEVRLRSWSDPSWGPRVALVERLLGRKLEITQR